MALLITPPVYDFAFYDLFSKPYGLLKIASWLQKGGWDVVYINSLDPYDLHSLEKGKRPRRKSNGTGKTFREICSWPDSLKPISRQFARYGICRESLIQQISSCSPDLILVTTGMTYWYRGVQEAIELCRGIHRTVPILAGGVYATLMPGHCHSVCGPDHVITGEGEEQIRQLLEHYHFPAAKESITEDLLIDNPVWSEAAVIRLNQGCPMKCEYCASSQMSSHFYPGDPEKTFQAIRNIHERWGTRNFAFYDDALLVNRDRLIKPLLEKIVQWKGNDFSFYLPNAVHARYLDREVLDLMARAGFQEIRMGYESSSEEFHTSRDDKINEALFEKTISTIASSLFPLERCDAYVLAGLPQQRWQDVEESVRTGSSYGIRCRIAQYSPVPGSTLWKESCRLSPLPLEDEPLYHNSTFFAMEWEGFNRGDLERIKVLTRELSPLIG